jgi:hypothetical protein
MDAWLPQLITWSVMSGHVDAAPVRTNWPRRLAHAGRIDTERPPIRGIPFDRARHGFDEPGGWPRSRQRQRRSGQAIAAFTSTNTTGLPAPRDENAGARSPFGPSYFGYLQDKSRFPGVPVVIASTVCRQAGALRLPPARLASRSHSKAEMALRWSAGAAKSRPQDGRRRGVRLIDEWTAVGYRRARAAGGAKPDAVIGWTRTALQRGVEPEPRWAAASRSVGELGLCRRSIRLPAARPRAGRTPTRRTSGYSQGPMARPEVLVASTSAMQGLRARAGAPSVPVGLEFVLQIASDTARLVAWPRANPYRVRIMARGWAKRDRRSPITGAPPGFFTGSYTQELNEPFLAHEEADGRLTRCSWLSIGPGSARTAPTTWAWATTVSCQPGRCRTAPGGGRTAGLEVRILDLLDAGPEQPPGSGDGQ